MRLSDATSDRLHADVARPQYDRHRQRGGIVHLGIGAFHRAHQAIYTDAAMNAGDRDWSITGVSLRSPQVRDQLAPQDGLFTVTQRGTSIEQARLVGSVRSVLVAAEEPAAVTRALSGPDTRVVTLTVTEKAYHRAPDGSLDIDVVAAGKSTIYHHLAKALAVRRDAGRVGLTIVPCDNLADNGRVLRDLLGQWLDREDPGLRGWFDRECCCASTMVDRIVPASTPAVRAEVERSLGLRDEGAVVTEPFIQWVVEDRFVSSRPRWEVLGALLVTDVRPYETAKLRMLNGAHSALAYLGLAAGHTFVHEAVADPAIRPTIERLMRIEAAGSIDPAPGQDLSDYADALLERFSNKTLDHRLAQIASDGSQKIVPRWLEPLAVNTDRQVRSPATLSALAAWVVHVRGDGPVDDPLAARLADLWHTAGSGGIVDALFGPGGMYSGVWTASPDLRAALGDLVQTRCRQAPVR